MESDQIKKNLDALLSEVEEFKKETKTQLEAAKKSYLPADRDEKLNRASEGLDKLIERVNQLEAQKNREIENPESKTEEEIIAKKAAFNKFLRKGAESLTVDEVKAMSVGSDVDGGYFVDPVVSSEIGKILYEQTAMRQLAEVISISSDAFEESFDWGDVSASWVGEGASRSATSTSAVKKLRIDTHEIYAKPKASQKLLEDAKFNLEAWLAGKVADKFARSEGAAFVSGTGVFQPMGILSYTSGDDWNKIEQVVSGSGSALTASGLIALQDSLYEAFQANAKFLMSRGTRSAVRKLVDGESRFLWSVEGGVNGGVQEMLLGKQVILEPNMPAIASNALSVAYGDFKAGYKIVDRVNISVLRDPYSSKPDVEFYTRKRVGGGVQQFQAIKIQKVST